MTSKNAKRLLLKSLAEIEEAIRLYGAPEQPAIELARGSIKQFTGAMHDAARLQAIATWARNAKEPYLDFHPDTNMGNVLEALCSVVPGLVALRLSDGVRVGDQTVLRRDALEGANSQLERLDRGDYETGMLGRTVSLPCISGSPYAFLGPLFEFKNPKGVKNDVQFFKLMKGLFAQVTRDQIHIPPSFVSACGIFASELFTNTQEHAIRDHEGVPYDAHVEGMILSWAPLVDRLYADDFEGHPKLKAFWERESVELQNGKEHGLRSFQLSFFDTGPGFASRATGKPTTVLGLQEEREALISSLHKAVTTKSGAAVGHGLPAVLAGLRKIGGLIRIRSGRHCIFNCFEPEDGTDLFNFDNWTTANLGAAAGAVISIIVPVRRS